METIEIISSSLNPNELLAAGAGFPSKTGKPSGGGRKNNPAKKRLTPNESKEAMQKTENLSPSPLNLNHLIPRLCADADGGNMGPSEAALAVREYGRYLELARRFPSVELVPTTLMDKAWHLHILDSQRYMADCEQLFGNYLHHVPAPVEANDDERGEMESLFQRTVELYFETFGEDMEASLAARCQGKPCHVPSSCRCRQLTAPR